MNHRHTAALALFWHVAAFVLYTLFAVVGLLQIVGTYRRWALIVDGPRMRRISKRRGDKYAMTYSHVIGSAVIIVSLLNLTLLIEWPQALEAVRLHPG
jgi:hypothetical protein